MKKIVRIACSDIGANKPTFVIAEIGLNHNGDIDIAKRLIDAAVDAGCNAVKFQKRTPELCVPQNERAVMRETPWGILTYLEYRERLEFSRTEFASLVRYCKRQEIPWFASCWDEPSVDFIEEFEPCCHKIASACLTKTSLLQKIKATRRPIIASTGMSTWEQISEAVALLDGTDLLIAHTTSTYPCQPAELNLRMIQTLARQYECPVGYSGHEVGLQTTLAAVVLGATFVERHFTLDRAMWGSDHAASLEPGGLTRLVRDIRVIEQSLGDGVKRVYESEYPSLKRLRGAPIYSTAGNG